MRQRHDDRATATDDLDGDITDRLVTDNPVNTARAGTYRVVYSVADVAGNAATATRTVIVNARPVIPVSRTGGGGGSLVYLLVLWILLGYRGYRDRQNLPA